MTWTLVPGLRLVRRETGVLQLGVDPPQVALLPDTPAVRRLVRDLGTGQLGGRLSSECAGALEAIVEAGLATPSETSETRRAARAAARVYLEAPDPHGQALRRMLDEAEIEVTDLTERASVAVVLGEAAVARGRLDGWLRDGVPHLVVTDHGDRWTLGPYVVPGRTACLRCVDAHAAETDPRRGLIVEQVADSPPLGTFQPEPTLTTMAMAWTGHDLLLAIEGDRPSTWSATISLGTGAPDVSEWTRHPYCGCSWADGLSA